MYKAAINIPDLKDDPPLHVAMRFEEVAIVQLLLEYGADLDLRGRGGDSIPDCIGYRARGGYTVVVRVQC